MDFTTLRKWTDRISRAYRRVDRFLLGGMPRGRWTAVLSTYWSRWWFWFVALVLLGFWVHPLFIGELPEDHIAHWEERVERYERWNAESEFPVHLDFPERPAAYGEFGLLFTFSGFIAGLLLAVHARQQFRTSMAMLMPSHRRYHLSIALLFMGVTVVVAPLWMAWLGCFSFLGGLGVIWLSFAAGLNSVRANYNIFLCLGLLWTHSPIFPQVRDLLMEPLLSGAALGSALGLALLGGVLSVVGLTQLAARSANLEKSPMPDGGSVRNDLGWQERWGALILDGDRSRPMNRWLRWHAGGTPVFQPGLWLMVIITPALLLIGIALITEPDATSGISVVAPVVLVVPLATCGNELLSRMARLPVELMRPVSRGKAVRYILWSAAANAAGLSLIYLAVPLVFFALHRDLQPEPWDIVLVGTACLTLFGFNLMVTFVVMSYGSLLLFQCMIVVVMTATCIPLILPAHELLNPDTSDGQSGSMRMVMIAVSITMILLSVPLYRWALRRWETMDIKTPTSLPGWLSTRRQG